MSACGVNENPPRTTFSILIDGLEITYTTGADANRKTSVVDMWVSILVKNTSNRVINIQYNEIMFGSSNHTFEFGLDKQNHYILPSRRAGGVRDFVNHNIQPGGVALIGSIDYMELFNILGRDYFLDGTICTGFEGVIQIDGRSHTLKFGPHCFKVAMDRDWKQEQRKYAEHFQGIRSSQ